MWNCLENGPVFVGPKNCLVEIFLNIQNMLGFGYFSKKIDALFYNSFWGGDHICF